MKPILIGIIFLLIIPSALADLTYTIDQTPWSKNTDIQIQGQPNSTIGLSWDEWLNTVPNIQMKNKTVVTVPVNITIPEGAPNGTHDKIIYMTTTLQNGSLRNGTIKFIFNIGSGTTYNVSTNRSCGYKLENLTIERIPGIIAACNAALCKIDTVEEYKQAIENFTISQEEASKFFTDWSKMRSDLNMTYKDDLLMCQSTLRNCRQEKQDLEDNKVGKGYFWFTWIIITLIIGYILWILLGRFITKIRGGI